MSFLDRIRAVNQHDLSAYFSFRVAGVHVGFVRPAFAAMLQRWPHVFQTNGGEVNLAPELDTLEARTVAVHQVLLQLREEGLITGWRDEMYPVNRFYSEPPYMLMERAAVRFFGICAYGVHLNAFVRDRDRVKMWLARRARDKATEPDKLDQLVAGGQPVGIGLKDNLVKESGEEAGMPPELAARAVSVGAVSYCQQTAQWVRPDVIFNFDLELPADFTPVNRDGEVEEFYLWPIEKVIETVRDTDAFKLNCALVVIDFLIRHGFIPPEHPDYMAMLHGLLGREKALELETRRRRSLSGETAG